DGLGGLGSPRRPPHVLVGDAVLGGTARTHHHRPNPDKGREHLVSTGWTGQFVSHASRHVSDRSGARLRTPAGRLPCAPGFAIAMLPPGGGTLLTLDDLNRRFAQADVLRFDAGAGGLPRAVISHP